MLICCKCCEYNKKIMITHYKGQARLRFHIMLQPQEPLGSCDRMKNYTHSVHLSVPPSIAIISVSDSKLLSLLWQSAV